MIALALSSVVTLQTIYKIEKQQLEIQILDFFILFSGFFLSILKFETAQTPLCFKMLIDFTRGKSLPKNLTGREILLGWKLRCIYDYDQIIIHAQIITNKGRIVDPFCNTKKNANDFCNSKKV